MPSLALPARSQTYEQATSLFSECGALPGGGVIRNTINFGNSHWRWRKTRYQKSGAILERPLWPEPIRVIASRPLGNLTDVEAEGLRTGRFYRSTLTAQQLGVIAVRTGLALKLKQRGLVQRTLVVVPKEIDSQQPLGVTA